MAGRKPGTSSFQRRGGRALPLGTVPSRQNAQLLVSTGVQSLDALLGGGVAVGATVLLQEDTHKMYSRTVLKLFLSEGLACGHGLSPLPPDISSCTGPETSMVLYHFNRIHTRAFAHQQSTQSFSARRLALEAR
eukprot:m.201596 g.201596  ORF g.201596 m.201596 type:complete len:134 (+) comp15347_c0_seq2:276-677(+)